MTKANTWLLPDGMDELLPQRAAAMESLRLKLLECYRTWGYQLVRPPMLEFLESLSVGTGSDLALQTFTLTDQLSGRLLGLRADITPQVARIDAHSLKQQGPARLCYCAPVLHSTSDALSDSRELDQIGIELFGSESVDADLEVVQLMLLSVEKAGALVDTSEGKLVKLDLGNVEIYRAIAQYAGLNAEAETELSEIIQRKALPELNAFIEKAITNDELAQLIRQLPSLCGNIDVIGRAREVFKSISDSQVIEKLNIALSQLEKVHQHVAQHFEQVECYFDLGEVRGYDYHTGLVFSVYKEGFAQALAKGGRYDSIGESFGRSRPASGFSADLRKLLCLSPLESPSELIPNAILIPINADTALKEKVKALRAQGEVLIQALGNHEALLENESCNRQLVYKNSVWQVQAL